MTTDLDGQRAFVMTMRAREQDIRRDKAASNICTNQALLALAASVYLATIGPHGLRDVAALGAARAAELESALAAAGAPRIHRRSVPQRVCRPRAQMPGLIHRRLLDRGILAGLVLADAEPDDPSLADGLLVCATEVTTSREIERFAEALAEVLSGRPPAAVEAGAGSDRSTPRRERSMSVTGTRLQPTIFERGRPGRGGGKIPHPPKDALDRIPAAARRSGAAGPAGDERAGRRSPLRQPVAAQLRGGHRVLPARLVHHEVQPEAQRMGGAPAGLRQPPSARPGRGRPGDAPDAVRARRGAGRDLRDARGHAPAGGRRPGRADRDPDDPGLPPGSRRHRPRPGARARIRATGPTRRPRRWPATRRSRSRRPRTAASTSTRSGRRSARGPRRS